MSVGSEADAIYEDSRATGIAHQRDSIAATAAARVRVYIISETRLFREGLSVILDREARFEVVGLGTNVDALESIERLVPELLLFDMAAPDPLVVVRQCRVMLPASRIIAVALAELDADVIACAEAGVSAYVTRDATVTELAATMLRALGGEVICPPRITARLFDRLATLSSRMPANPEEESLTRREREIAHLIAQGFQNKEIARQLGLGHATIKNHVHNILGKLKLQRRGEIFGRMLNIGT
jgi:two-component system, NarL family, nitrate/nitrite response regulator NarL